MRNKVYILGAGCSARYGCPTAKDVAQKLEAFSQTMDGNAARLKRCIEETVQMMKTENVKTIDDLASRIHAGAFDRLSGHISAGPVRQESIWKAKLAMAVYLLAIESKARKSGLEGYHNLLHELCPGSGTWEERFRASKGSVLTFNYDRLFEMAFLQRNGGDLNGRSLYGEHCLNSGFGDFGGKVEFADGGFCFLKLHGCVGRFVDWSRRDPHYPTVFGDIRPGEKINIHDDTFFPKFESRPKMSFQPLLVFPHEKQHVQGGKLHALYQSYITAVWKKAEQLISEADEIWIIGYSFNAIDRNALIDLLLKAKRCGALVIQNINGEADRICHEMPLKHSDLKLDWRPCRLEF